MAGRRGGTAAAARKPSKQKHNDKFTIEQIIAALEASGGIKTIAASKLGCDRTTLDGYARRYWEVEEALDRISADKLDFAEAKLLKHIEEGNLTAIIFFLKTQGKARGYVERVELTGKDGKPVEITAKAASVRSEMARRLARLAGGQGAAVG